MKRSKTVLQFTNCLEFVDFSSFQIVVADGWVFEKIKTREQQIIWNKKKILTNVQEKNWNKIKENYEIFWK